jgi:hypothetical protein
MKIFAIENLTLGLLYRLIRRTKRVAEAVTKEDPTSQPREDRYQQFLNQKRELQSRSLTSGIF